jgi:hypothetical protein
MRKHAYLLFSPQIMHYMLNHIFDGIIPSFLPGGMVDWMSKIGFSVLIAWLLMMQVLKAYLKTMTL